jgi:hypothetical protein
MEPLDHQIVRTRGFKRYGKRTLCRDISALLRIPGICLLISAVEGDGVTRPQPLDCAERDREDSRSDTQDTTVIDCEVDMRLIT